MQTLKLVFFSSSFSSLKENSACLVWSSRVQLIPPQNALRRGGSLWLEWEAVAMICFNLINTARAVLLGDLFPPTQKGGVYVQLWGITHKRFKQWKKKTSSFLLGPTQPTKVSRRSQWKDRLWFTENSSWKMETQTPSGQLKVWKADRVAFAMTGGWQGRLL